MLQRCFRLASISRTFSRSSVFRIVSPSFALDKEWNARHDDLNRLGLGGDYEWISAVQKKFIGGGIASAVDVDAAVCVAEQKDQVDDVLELLFKLRHGENAADLIESSEYAMVRLLLTHQPSTILKLANDPFVYQINYGIFLNTHAACLAIDHFLKANNVQGAARLVAWVTQQEDTNNELLNLLGLYTCAKWAELPIGEQNLPMAEEEEEEEINDDDIRTFKFPYLKNESFDSHFDLTNAHHLIGKSLLWIVRDTKCVTDDLRSGIRFLGAVLYDRLDLALTLATSVKDPTVCALVRQRLQPKEEGAEISDAAAALLTKIEGVEASEAGTSLSSTILEQLEKIRSEEEGKLMKAQREYFVKWNERRRELANAQAEKVLLKIRAEEIKAELAELDKQEEKFDFFEKRLMWEKRAAENEEIEREAAARNARASQ